VPGGVGGTFSVAANGAFAYTPRYGFAGLERVPSEVSDGRGGSDTATVWIHVVNAAPVVESEHFRIRNDETASGAGTVTIEVAANKPPAAGDDKFTTRPPARQRAAQRLRPGR
jgi:hypothetical protein